MRRVASDGYSRAVTCEPVDRKSCVGGYHNTGLNEDTPACRPSARFPCCLSDSTLIIHDIGREECRANRAGASRLDAMSQCLHCKALIGGSGAMAIAVCPLTRGGSLSGAWPRQRVPFRVLLQADPFRPLFPHPGEHDKREGTPMCGRFTVQLTGGQIHELYDVPQQELPMELPLRYNGAPTQEFAACRMDDDGRRVVARLRWGLVPFWAKDAGMGARLINARAETVSDKPAFRAAFRSAPVPGAGQRLVRMAGCRSRQATLVCRPGKRRAVVVCSPVGTLGQGAGRPRDLHDRYDRCV